MGSAHCIWDHDKLRIFLKSVEDLKKDEHSDLSSLRNRFNLVFLEVLHPFISPLRFSFYSDAVKSLLISINRQPLSSFHKSCIFRL